MTPSAQDQRDRAEVMVDERTGLVQLAPCCLDHMWGSGGSYDRARLAAHLTARHTGREAMWPVR